MAKRVALNFYYDWMKPFEMLTDREFRELVVAMVRYSRDGEEPPEFSGYAKMAAEFIFPQIKRSMICQKNGEKGGLAKASNVNSVDGEMIDEAEKSEDDGLFEEFWEAYPKKSGKTSSRETFRRMDIDRDRLSEILRAVERQKNWESWKREGGRYIPSPSTWLSRGQWEDEEHSVKEEASVKAEPKKSQSKSSSFDTDDFFNAALRRSYGDELYEQIFGNGSE